MVLTEVLEGTFRNQDKHELWESRHVDMTSFVVTLQ